MTGILQRLVRKKFLAREVDPADSRRVRLTVRPRGEAFTRRSRGTVEAAVARALAHLPAIEVQRARRVLTTVIDALGAESD